MPKTMNVSGEYQIRVNGTNIFRITPDGVTSSSAITGATITASTEFRGTVLTSNAAANIDFKTSGGTQFRAGHVANVVNFVEAWGNAAGGPARVFASGSESNVGLRIASKGTSAVQFYTGGTADVGAANQFEISDTPSAVNRLRVTGGATGSPGVVTLSCQGSDADINAAINAKGTGAVRLASNYTRYLSVIGSASSNVTLQASDGSLVLTSAGGGTTVRSDLPMYCLTGTAIPAGGTAGSGFRLSSTSNFGIFFGSGAPTLAAAQGSIYLRSDGSSTSTRLYVNTDGSTTWTNVTTAA